MRAQVTTVDADGEPNYPITITSGGKSAVMTLHRLVAENKGKCRAPIVASDPRLDASMIYGNSEAYLKARSYRRHPTWLTVLALLCPSDRGAAVALLTRAAPCAEHAARAQQLPDAHERGRPAARDDGRGPSGQAPPHCRRLTGQRARRPRLDAHHLAARAQSPLRRDGR